MAQGFNVLAMNGMLNALSQNATWEQATLCPNKAVTSQGIIRTGGHDTTCPVCLGNGIVWDSGVACRVALEGMHSTREFAMFTEWEKGDLMATLPSDSDAYAAGEWDRFTLTDSTLRFNHILIRGVTDQVKYKDVVSVDSLWAIINAVRQDFTRGVDYTLTGKQITWITNTLPPGQQYSITYVAHPAYFVFKDLVQDRPHGITGLPRKVHLRLMELFNRSLVS